MTKSLHEWINLIHAIIAKSGDDVQKQSWIQPRFDKKLITIQTPYSYIAKGVWNEHTDLEELGFGLRILVGKETIISSRWIKE